MSRLSPDDTILGLLATETRHGYQLLELFRSGGVLETVWNLSTSQLYAILNRLKQKGLIIGEEVAAADAPTRTEYQLTEAGQERLHTWLYDDQPSPSPRRLRTEFLSRLHIAQHLGVALTPIIDSQRTACQQHQQVLISRRDKAESGVNWLALDLLIAEMDVILAWIDRCQTHLEAD
jgi:DNA-binding PadR family transcriptional regulator